MLPGLSERQEQILRDMVRIFSETKQDEFYFVGKDEIAFSSEPPQILQAAADDMILLGERRFISLKSAKDKTLESGLLLVRAVAAVTDSPSLNLTSPALLARARDVLSGGLNGAIPATKAPSSGAKDVCDLGGSDAPAQVNAETHSPHSQAAPTSQKNATSKLSRHRKRSKSPVPSGVFIVHGQDVAAREATARLVSTIGLNPIILQEQIDEGKTIIEKFERHSAEAAFAIVLLTPDDIGGAAGTKPRSLRLRARQNVMFELGFFVARLGRQNVCAVRKGDVEILSDYSGVIYTDMDAAGAWRFSVAAAMKAAGLPARVSRLIQLPSAKRVAKARLHKREQPTT